MTHPCKGDQCARMSRDDFLHEVRHFRQFGLTDRQIARRLAMSWTSFERRMYRYGATGRRAS